MPCGTSFVIQKAEQFGAGGMIRAQLKQTQEVLLAAVSSEVDVHKHPSLAALAGELDAAGPDAVDVVRRAFEFHQPLPPGFLAVVLSRCAKRCGDDTAVWRHDLVTLTRVDAAAVPHAMASSDLSTRSSQTMKGIR
jgi:hypothetical protein